MASQNSGASLNLAPTSIGAPPKKDEAETVKMTATRALWLFLWHGHLALVGACIFFFLAAQTTRQVSDFWVRWWVQDWHHYFTNPKVQEYSVSGSRACRGEGNGSSVG